MDFLKAIKVLENNTCTNCVHNDYGTPFKCKYRPCELRQACMLSITALNIANEYKKELEGK